jgi:hypothetical protein
MKAHGAEKLLEDVQTYHDMHEEIVVQKMHQVTPPRSGGAFSDKSCGNPQCRKGNCRQPRHNTIGFCSATQTAKINDAAEGNFAPLILNKRSKQSKFADPLLLTERTSGATCRAILPIHFFSAKGASGASGVSRASGANYRFQ